MRNIPKGKVIIISIKRYPKNTISKPSRKDSTPVRGPSNAIMIALVTGFISLGCVTAPSTAFPFSTVFSRALTLTGMLTTSPSSRAAITAVSNDRIISPILINFIIYIYSGNETVHRLD
jgi:hypothetical protein